MGPLSLHLAQPYMQWTLRPAMDPQKGFWQAERQGWVLVASQQAETDSSSQYRVTVCGAKVTQMTRR